MNAMDPGVVWHTAARLGGRLADMLRRAQADVVKSAPHRTVYRVRLPGLDAYLKEYRTVGLRGWLRELIRPVKAKAEFDRAVALAACGVPVPRPLGWGVLGPARRPRASFVLTEAADARPLADVVAKPLTPLARQRLANDLGAFIARLHAAGVAHRDFHPGNVLDGTAGLMLIDLHGVIPGRPLSWRRRRDNLAVFNRYFSLRASRTDRLRFWRAYRAAAGDSVPDRPDATPAALERETVALNRALWAARQKKCVSEGRQFRTVRCGRVRGWRVADLPADVAASLAAEPDAWLDAKRLKSGGASTVALTAAGVVKRFNVRRLADLFKNMLRTSAARRSWVMGHALADAWLPTARPLALVQRRRGPFPAEGYLLTEYLHNTSDLRAFLDGRPPIPSLRNRIDAVARVVRRFHDRHFGHRDLKAGNLLTTADPADTRVWFIDLVGVYRRRRVSRKSRVGDLTRLAASFLSHPSLTHGGRLHFLLAYLGPAGRAGGAWKRWWRELAARAQVKQARNARLGRVLG